MNKDYSKQWDFKASKAEISTVESEDNENMHEDQLEYTGTYATSGALERLENNPTSSSSNAVSPMITRDMYLSHTFLGNACNKYKENRSTLIPEEASGGSSCCASVSCRCLIREDEALESQEIYPTSPHHAAPCSHTKGRFTCIGETAETLEFWRTVLSPGLLPSRCPGLELPLPAAGTQRRQVTDQIKPGEPDTSCDQVKALMEPHSSNKLIQVFYNDYRASYQNNFL